MEIRQLKYFLSVADHRSFGNAAGSLFVTRQAISKAISQLEEELQVDLFFRQPNGVFLTPAGVKFYDYVKHLVSEYDKVRTEMLEYGNSFSQKIRIAFSIGLTGLFERGLKKDVRPNLEIRYEEIPGSEVKSILLDRHADLAVGSSASTEPAYVSVPVMTSEIGILTSALMDGEERVDMELLNCMDVGCIRGDAGIDRFCKTEGIVPSYEGYDYHRLMGLAREGRCALLLPRALWREESADLRWKPIFPEPKWTVYVSHLRALENNMLLWNAMEEIQKSMIKAVDSLMDLV